MSARWEKGESQDPYWPTQTQENSHTEQNRSATEYAVSSGVLRELTDSPYIHHYYKT